MLFLGTREKQWHCESLLWNNKNIQTNTYSDQLAVTT